MILEHIVVGSMQNNCYLLGDKETNRALIIDPGGDAAKIKAALVRLRLRAEFILLTHGHIDHISAVDDFNIPVYVHAQEQEMLTSSGRNLFSAEIKVFGDADKIRLDRITLKAIHTPGHTQGGASFLLLTPLKDILFSGDTLFYEGVGRTDLEGGDAHILLKSIRDKILALPDDTTVYPGHGPKTTVGWEKKHNPFL